MLIKKYCLLIFFISAALCCKAQFYFDFEESKSFYDKSAFLRSSGFKKETVVVKQMKNKMLEDSFRIIVTHYNSSGDPVSMHIGSKWKPVILTDTIEYNSSGKQSFISYAGESANTSPARNDPPGADLPDTLQHGGYRYEYDTLNKVKKVFYKRSAYKEMLQKLIFYDDQNRIIKIDHAPESERVSYTEYRYKKDKLKIYSVYKNSRNCDERMTFNDAGQVIKRDVDFMKYGQWSSNTYYFTYTADHLLLTEKKFSDGKLYTAVTHYYGD